MYLLQLVQALKFENITSSKSQDPTSDSSLAHFLISRSIQNPLLGNNFHWYLMVECEDRTSSSHKTFAKVAFQFMKSLSETSDGVERRGVFKRQAELVGKLQSISREIRAMRGDRGRKIERLKASIKEYDLDTMDPSPLFLDAAVQMVGVDLGSPLFSYGDSANPARRRISVQVQLITLALELQNDRSSTAELSHYLQDRR